MLTYDLGLRGKEPLYEFLYRSVKEDLLCGRIRAGEKLPSKRKLAEHLGVSVVTVENAYSRLADEGYVVSRERSGYYAEDVMTFPSGEPAAAAAVPTPAREPAPPVDLTSNRTRPEDFPFPSWCRTMRSVISMRYERILDPAEAVGSADLREAISRHLFRTRRMETDPDRIVVGAGGEYMYNLITILLGRGLVYGTEDPGYRKIGEIYRMNGARTVPIPVDGRGAMPEEAERAGADVLHISPSHHFPSGVVMPASRRREVIGWASRGDRYVVEDDYDSEFRFNGRPIPSISSVDGAGRVIYVNTFSKTLSPSVRIGYMILPAPLMERYRERLGHLSCPVSAFEQHTLASFMESGDFERHINRMKKKYRLRRDAVISALTESPFSDLVEIEEEDAGLHFLLKIDTDLTDGEVKELLLGAGVRASFLSDYSTDPASCPAHRAVINYSSADPDGLREALRRLADLVGKTGRRRPGCP